MQIRKSLWLMCIVMLSALLVACGGGRTTPTTNPGSSSQDATEEANETPTESTVGDETEEATEVSGDEVTMEATDEATEAVMDATDEATESMTDEATEESIVADTTEEPTEVAMAEETDEATETVMDEATDEASVEPTEAASDEATDEVTTEATEAASDEATMEATDEATDEAEMQLDATFTSEDGSVTFDYPGDWVVEEVAPNQFMLATSEDAMDTTGEVAAGEFRAVIFVNSISEVPELSADSTATDVLDTLREPLNQMLAETEGVNVSGDEATVEAGDEATVEAGDMATEEADFFGEPNETTISGHEAAMIEGSHDNGDAVVYVINLDDGYFAIVVGASASDEMSDFGTVLEDIAASITYTPSADMATEEAGRDGSNSDMNATEEATTEASS